MTFNQDFQAPRNSGQNDQTGKPAKRFLLVALLVVLVSTTILWLISPGPEIEARETPVNRTGPPPEPLPKLPELPPEPVIETVRNVVPDGSSITALLGDHFSAQEILELDRRSRDIFPFTRICAGRPYRITTEDGRFASFVYEIDDQEQLIISRQGDEVVIERQPIIYEVTTELVQGVISTSLFDAVTAIGEDPAFAIMLADIFQWDIDFILDIRSGDTFRALVEKRSRDGHSAGYGHILAAEFVNQGTVFRVARFQDGDQPASYYNESGENVRKAFLKAPVSFTRISSGYTMKRFHPISKTWKAHPAIDYVAPVGTPIKTVGDGTISRIGYTKYNGNFIEIRHSNGYRTIYLHMKGFARGMKLNKRVAQGQVIGYLGGTGMATGPHLCFRMKKDGAPVNPTRLRAPAAKAVSKDNLAAFQERVAPLFAQLEGGEHQPDMVASLETSASQNLPEEQK